MYCEWVWYTKWLQGSYLNGNLHCTHADLNYHFKVTKLLNFNPNLLQLVDWISLFDSEAISSERSQRTAPEHDWLFDFDFPISFRFDACGNGPHAAGKRKASGGIELNGACNQPAEKTASISRYRWRQKWHIRGFRFTASGKRTQLNWKKICTNGWEALERVRQETQIETCFRLLVKRHR